MNYDAIRPLFGGKLTQAQINGLETLMAATEGMPVSHRAYLLATAKHETDNTMQPIREYGRGKGKAYGRPGRNRGQIPYGRGYVQLTWDQNYERADRELKLGGVLVKNYDAALNPELAAKILVRGCSEGWFTGKKLSDYLPGDYRGARRVVNGLDRADLIAQYAVAFEKAIAAQPAPKAPQGGIGAVIAALLAAVAAGATYIYQSLVGG